MRRLRFESVTVETRHVGRYRVIASVDAAADFLAHDWPTEKGPIHLRARIACLDALENALSADEAREAFIEAAKESGILIRDDR
ncbi:DUF982 domain-containing protein [Phyllobacterium zundukense]|uniref:DUF982 domain-containing protein n=2 Tax=Phyllobacterium zundukense TaxID=1867719 RepID=A0A2N9VUE2_9HYPH|nr:DUF982 domain-containing protein [Phyllobacterium zundukense]PIO43110.1 hypothetical protein B5P45_20800 [Phyllobacterium zundukense]